MLIQSGLHIKLLVVTGLSIAIWGLFGAIVATDLAGAAKTDQKSLIIAGGCFWCIEADFDKLEGVLSTTSGYIGGGAPNPTYKEVSGGETGHAEAVKIVYDPSKITFGQLLDHFWINIDPTVKNRQFCDVGSQYRTAIFYADDEQKQEAITSLNSLKLSKPFPEPIVTEIIKGGAFYPAEKYHQDYYRKNPLRYKVYRYGCGRDKRLKELWGVD